MRKTSAGEASPSCDQLGRQLRVAAVAQLDLDAGLLGELRRDLLEQLLVLGVVDDDRRTVVPGAAGGRESGDQGQAGELTSTGTRFTSTSQG